MTPIEEPDQLPTVEASHIPVGKENKNKEKRSKSVEPLIIDFMKNTTFHGLAQIIYTPITLLKITWLVILLISAIVCFEMIYMTCVKFLEWNVVTNINFISEDELTLPAITICNINPSTGIDQMLLSCKYIKKNCSKLDFLPTDIYKNSSSSSCFTYNMGFNSSGSKADLEKVYNPAFTLEMVIFTGIPSIGTNIFANGLHVIFHSQDKYEEYTEGFNIPTGIF
jgi:hypothetical protein